MSLITTRAVLLRSFPYSETSRVLRFYTETLGAVGVMAKGVRSGAGKSGSGLETFAEGALTIHVKPTRELQTLRDFAPARSRRELGADLRRFGGASLLGEIVLKHAGEESNPVLFEALTSGLDRMSAVPREAVLPTILREGWRLVEALGYRPILATCVECGDPIPADDITRFDFGAGGLRCPRCSRSSPGPRLGPGARAQLHALVSGGDLPALDRPKGHLRLLADFVAYHLSEGRPLASFEVLVGLLEEGSRGPSREDSGEEK